MLMSWVELSPPLLQHGVPFPTTSLLVAEPRFLHLRSEALRSLASPPQFLLSLGDVPQSLFPPLCSQCQNPTTSPRSLEWSPNWLLGTIPNFLFCQARSSTSHSILLCVLSPLQIRNILRVQIYCLLSFQAHRGFCPNPEGPESSVGCRLPWHCRS